MKWRQGRGGEENGFKIKKERQRGCMYGKRKRTYSILTDEWEGDRRSDEKSCQKTKIKGDHRVRAWVWREVQFLLILEFCFFSFFPRFCQFLSSRPSFLSLSPTGPPAPLFPLLFFLACAGTLSPTSLSLSLSFSLSPADHALHFPLILCLCPLHLSIHRTLFFSFFFNPLLPLQNTDIRFKRKKGFWTEEVWQKL